jgi:hypothetical protein
MYICIYIYKYTYIYIYIYTCIYTLGPVRKHADQSLKISPVNIHMHMYHDDY